jgi:hypothetical protein
MSTALVQVDEKALAKLEAVAEECGLKAVDSAGRFTQAMKLSAGIQALREMLTPAIMARVMSLQNSPLGFLTDHNPATSKPGQVVEPYGVEVVRDCLIEATLRGFYPVNNEFNIISSRCYGTKNGYARLVKNFPGLSDLILSPGVPAMAGEKGALVPYSAHWRLNGKPDNIIRKVDKETGEDTRITVRVNFGMGADAIIGKATRKMLAAIYGKITGSENTMPEGEVGDEPLIEGSGKTVDVRQLPMDKISPGKPEDHQGHDTKAPIKPKAAPASEPAAEEDPAVELAMAKDELSGLLSGMNAGSSDAILESNGIANLESCTDLNRVQKALGAAKWAAENSPKKA